MRIKNRKTALLFASVGLTALLATPGIAQTGGTGGASSTAGGAADAQTDMTGQNQGALDQQETGTTSRTDTNGANQGSYSSQQTGQTRENGTMRSTPGINPGSYPYNGNTAAAGNATGQTDSQTPSDRSYGRQCIPGQMRSGTSTTNPKGMNCNTGVMKSTPPATGNGMNTPIAP